RAGVAAILAPDPDLVLVGSAADEEELWPLLRRTRPSVVVLDLHHPGRNGLTLCLQIKRGLHPPAVVLYSATTPTELVVAGAVAERIREIVARLMPADLMPSAEAA